MGLSTDEMSKMPHEFKIKQRNIKNKVNLQQIGRNPPRNHPNHMTVEQQITNKQAFTMFERGESAYGGSHRQITMGGSPTP